MLDEDRFFEFPQLAIRKAKALIQTRNVFQLNACTFTVDGNHGSYLVRVLPSGRLDCTCPGFKERQICTHALAVCMLIEQREDDDLHLSAEGRGSVKRGSQGFPDIVFHVPVLEKVK